MSETDRRNSDEVRQPEPPLPDESGLSLEEHLAMQQAIGHPTRFRILRTVVANDELSAADLKAAVDVESHNLHYHLDELVDVGLVDKRQRRTADSQGFYTYYRPTAMGNGILEHGVEELTKRIRDWPPGCRGRLPERESTDKATPLGWVQDTRRMCLFFGSPECTGQPRGHSPGDRKQFCEAFTGL